VRRKRSVTEADSVSLDAKEKSARFVVGIRTTIDDDSVTWMKRGEHFLELDPVWSSPCNFSRKGAPLFSKAGVNELLMVYAMKPTREKATTEGHLQSVFLLLRGGGGVLVDGTIDGLAINGGDGGNVVRGFEPTLDLERVKTEFDQFGDFIHRGEVLGREKVGPVPEIAGLAIDFEGVGHAAGLSALATVGAAATEDFAGEALA
jgi:hypothetical protein